MKTRTMIYSAIFIALGITLPIAFHYFGTALGPVFLPMHIPVLLAGAYLGPFAGLLVGGVTPVLSSLFTGMPPVIPMLPIMFFELMIYGGVIGYFYSRKGLNIYPSLLTSIVMGRVGVGIVVWVMVHLFQVTRLPGNPLVYVWGSVLKGLPGIAIQLILIPLVVKYLQPYQSKMDFGKTKPQSTLTNK